MTDESVAEFVNSVEEQYPLTSHPKYQKEWMDDIRDFASDIPGIEPEVLDCVLDFRKMVNDAAVNDVHEVPSDDTWKWLLTTHQVEQRTEEWYAETTNILTASEVSAVFKGGRTRGALVLAKASPQVRKIGKPLAVSRSETRAMDWGVRYEPVVKSYLEKTLKCKITELGRIRHRNDPKIAASPDGLITECEDNNLIGRLVEIKCPYTREINDTISFEYWCQMQLQMEVCDRPACEFVEVKIKEGDVETPGGYITLVTNINTLVNEYLYSDASDASDSSDALDMTSSVIVEKYAWQIVYIKRVTVLRDTTWFKESQKTFDAFWKDVEGAKDGSWTSPPARVKKTVDESPIVKCDIIEDETPMD